MNRILTIAAAALVAGVGAPLSGMLAIPAAAAEQDAITVSLDGVTFSDSPKGSLFPNGVKLVPGSTATTTLHVRNDSHLTGELRLAISGTDAPRAELLETLTVAASSDARRSDGRPVRLHAGDRCALLLSGQLLEPQEVTEITIELSMLESAGNDSQHGRVDAELTASLRDPAAPTAGSTCTEYGSIPLTPPPGAGPDENRPPSDTTEPIPAVEAPQPTADPRDTEVPTPEAPTPEAASPAAGTPPIVSAATGLPMPLVGTAGLALGVAGFLVARLRRRRSS